MKIIIPNQIKESIKTIGNITLQKNAYKIYYALYKKEKRKNPKSGYFQIPSIYLKSLNLRYYRIIDKFINDGIIKYLEREVPTRDLTTKIKKKFYSTDKGICMYYKFLIDLTIGEEIEINFDNPNKKRWFDITRSTLECLGYDNIKIIRDDFGRRVHHNAIRDYKEYLSNKGLSVIDAKCSQPRLLYLLMKNKNIIDIEYFKIFESNKDFYYSIVSELDLFSRQEAKDLFMYWINANGYVPNNKIYSLFPITSKFIKDLKNKSYKDSSSYLQREEAKIWIDDLLENIPSNFALTIHDSLIIKTKESNKILDYCKEKYPQIEFELKEL